MKNNDILIIGGGIAGMTAGIYAQKSGLQATILEMHENPGGQLTAWERNGYLFDYCLHWLVGTDHGTYHDIWRETNAITDDVQIINHRTYAKMVDEKHGEFIVYNNLDEWEEYLINLAPEDKKSIEKMCRLMRKGNRLDQFENPPGMRSVLDYFSSFLHIGSFFPILIKYGKRNCQELLEELGFNNQRLLYFLNRLFVGRDFSAISFIVMFGWFHAKNAGYLLGGSSAMTRRMAEKFSSLGGQFRFKSKVTEIVVENDTAIGVKLENDEIIYTDHVIGACDGHTVLFDMLKGNYLDDKIKKAYADWPLFTPIVMVSFGINDVIESENHITSYFKEGLSIGSTKIESYNIMNRSSYDPAFAPEGKTVLLCQFESPWSHWENLEATAYPGEKEAIRKDAVNLLEKHYPGITEKIEVIDIATPLTTVRYTGVWQGSYEGFLPTLDITNELPMKLPRLKNFTMIGQWLYPGGGLPPSAQSGKWAIKMLCEEKKLAFKSV